MAEPKMRSIEQAWFMFFRSALEPDGRWHVWERTGRRLRSDCIRDAIADGYSGMRDRADYRRLRRRGAVRCARATVWARLPGEPQEGRDD